MASKEAQKSAEAVDSVIIKEGYLFVKETRYHIYQAGDKSLTPLLIYPAFFSEIENWRAIIKAFAKKRHVVFFDLPGQGESTAFKEGFSSDRLMEDIPSLTRQVFGGEKYDLFAYSYGGLLALKTVSLYSKDVKSLILSLPLVSANTLNQKYDKFVKLRALLDIISWGIVKKGIRAALEPNNVPKTVDVARKIGLLNPGKEVAFYIKTITAIAQVETAPFTAAEIIKDSLHANLQFPEGSIEQTIYLLMQKDDPVIGSEATIKALEALAKNIKHFSLDEIKNPDHTDARPSNPERVAEVFGKIIDQLE